MLRAAWWQWDRHVSKLSYIETLQENLSKPVIQINDVLSKNNEPETLIFRRVEIAGQYDFKNEMILRNRKHNSLPGVFVITPMKIAGHEKHILVSRGFLPLSLSNPEKRKLFQKPDEVQFTGLIKSTVKRRLFAPEDPPAGRDLPWVDAWLRMDLDNMAKQLPYPIEPFFIEIMNTEDSTKAQELIVRTESDRDEMFFLAGKGIPAPPTEKDDLSQYPIVVFDTVVPPTRHLGYVFEWSAMALMTIIIAIILQLRRPKLAS